MRHGGGNILPTPDPTIASCISDEDVALQLMRLGDASNFSYGRTSASTLNDAFSERADVASSATSNSGDESDMTEQPTLPTAHPGMKVEPGLEQLKHTSKKRRLMDDILPSFDSTEPSGDEVDGDYEGEHDDQKQRPHAIKSKKIRAGSASAKSSKSSKSHVANKKPKPSNLSTAGLPPMLPASTSQQARKSSLGSTINFQHQLGVDEDDLSSKPRCQRCRKSKKGCDRQRPCQRCKDAGIGAEGCVSEDEGNGRKGRYGRHMGISVKKSIDSMDVDGEMAAADTLSGLAGALESPDKNKKRKR